MTSAKTVKKPLPAESGDLVKLCEKVGWTSRKAHSGTLIQIPGGDAVLVPDRLTGGRSANNVHAALRRAGIEALLDSVEQANEERRAAGTAASAAAALRRPGPPPNGAATKTTTPDPTTRDQGMVTHLVDVTPDLAREWLDRLAAHLADGTLVTQRPCRDAHVIWLAEQMENGTFKTTPQGVSLAPTDGNTGQVLDGRHRLEAVVLSRCTVPMRVTFNVPPELFDVFDTGKVRSAGDVLAIVGETQTYHLASVAKLLAVWRMWEKDRSGLLRDWRSWNRVKLTNAEVVAAVQAHPGLGDQMRLCMSFVGPPVRINVAAAVVFRLWATESWPECANTRGDEPSILDAWFHQLREGYDLTRGDPVALLRNWLLSHGARRTAGAARETTLVALVKCWNNTWPEKKSMELLRIGSNDLMPVPYKP